MIEMLMIKITTTTTKQKTSEFTRNVNFLNNCLHMRVNRVYILLHIFPKRAHWNMNFQFDNVPSAKDKSSIQKYSQSCSRKSRTCLAVSRLWHAPHAYHLILTHRRVSADNSYQLPTPPSHMNQAINHTITVLDAYRQWWQMLVTWAAYCEARLTSMNAV